MNEPEKSVYPPLGLCYRVQFSNRPYVDGPDASFKEISGLSVTMQHEEIVEGGENRFRHRVPTAARYENLVLRRGLCLGRSALYAWLTNGISGGLSGRIKPESLLIYLLNDDGETLRSWQLTNAWPVKWELSGLNATEAQVAIESMELSYQYFAVVRKDARPNP